MSAIKPNTNAYAAAHMWIRNNYGTPRGCENCKTKEDRMYHWSNISREYKRDRDDWLRLCVPCHKRNDIKALGGKIKARARIAQPSKVCIECGVTFLKDPHYSQKQWESKEMCSKTCSARRTGRKLKGTTQSDETKALKSQKLRERWQTPEWREHMTTTMIGNQYAKKSIQ